MGEWDKSPSSFATPSMENAPSPSLLSRPSKNEHPMSLIARTLSSCGTDDSTVSDWTIKPLCNSLFGLVYVWHSPYGCLVEKRTSKEMMRIKQPLVSDDPDNEAFVLEYLQQYVLQHRENMASSI